jgi:hypothetical protein
MPPTRPLLRQRIVLHLVVMLLAGGTLGAACGQSSLAIMPGVINDPANRSLRRSIFSYAIGELCQEMQRRSVPLKLRDEDPSIGRFYPSACSVRELDNENLFLQVLGHGYAWTNVTGRIGFEASAAIEYDHDFRMHDDAMYVYFRQVQAQSTEFRTLMVEKGAQAGGVAGMFGQNVQQATTQIGNRLLTHQLARGFTVIREEDGSAAFGLGLLPVGQRPPEPFRRGDSDWLLLANDRSEIHSGQRDYVGPFLVEDDEQALHLTMVVEGAPAVDVLVVPKSQGDPWLGGYERQAGAAPLQGNPLLDEAVAAAQTVPGQAPTQWRRRVPLPKGLYYLVLDNTSSAGRTQSSGQAHDDRAALVSYGVQLGD